MITATEIPTKQHPLAQHYLRQLHNANHMYLRGNESIVRSLQLFEQEWPQIRHWLTSAAGSDTSDTDTLTVCSEFS